MKSNDDLKPPKYDSVILKLLKLTSAKVVCYIHNDEILLLQKLQVLPKKCRKY